MEGTTSASCTQTYHIQPSTFSSSRLTYFASFEVKLQFVKVPLLPLFVMETAPPCKQVTRTNQPHTHTQTHTQTTVSPSMLACIHSIRHLLSITRSQERTNHVSPLPFITIIHQPCIARYHSVWHSYMHASRCHGSHTMEWKVCMHTGCQPPPYRETYIHTCMHAQR